MDGLFTVIHVVPLRVHHEKGWDVVHDGNSGLELATNAVEVPAFEDKEGTLNIGEQFVDGIEIPTERQY
jgi:hypothetical protein